MLGHELQKCGNEDRDLRNEIIHIKQELERVKNMVFKIYIANCLPQLTLTLAQKSLCYSPGAWRDSYE